MQIFDYNQVTCLHPKIVRNPYTNELISVPCGKCSSCLSRKALLWSSRCQEESSCHTFTLFGTLTYSNEHLTYVNPFELDSAFYTDSFNKALELSSDYIKFCDNKIPCLNVHDIQLFFKRLRSKINYNYGPGIKIRYFVAAEYGPTTFRPHWHYLLWFDSPELAKVIKQYIYEAWKSFTDYSSEKAFFGRNKTRFVHGYVERYVAGYVNKSPNLPAVLCEKPFRQFHVQSNNPPIGAIRFLRESISGLLTGNVDKITLHKSSTGQSIVLPLWRGLENRLFPKCIGFADLSFDDKVKLYGLYSEFRSTFESSSSLQLFELSFKDFQQWSDTEWQKTNYGFQLFKSLLSKEVSERESYTESLRRLYAISKRVVQLSENFGIAFKDYVSAICEYYRRKEYNALVIQMRFQEKLSNSPRSDVDLRYYPMIIDSLFYNNMRKLDSYQDYLHQFNLIEYDPIFFVPEFSVPYLQKKAMSDFYVFDSNRKRENKDYIASHPECFQNYKSLLRPVQLTL